MIYGQYVWDMITINIINIITIIITINIIIIKYEVRQFLIFYGTWLLKNTSIGPRHIGKPVSEVKADEVQKRQSGEMYSEAFI